MDENEFTGLLSYSERMMKEKAVDVLRPASQDLIESMSNHKLINGIKGLRGVGKSSLLLEVLKKSEKSMYIGAEFLLKHGYGLYDVLDYAYSQGITSFGIDEIQVLNDWPLDLKLFYDESKAKITITGSSAIDVGVKSSDLARRISLVDLKPFSFREYIYFKTKTLLKKRTMKSIREDKLEIAKEVAPFINLYPEFLHHYGLPAAFFDGKEVYPGVIERIVYRDLLPLKSIDSSYIDSSFKLLKFLASCKPGEVSYSAIANSIDRSTKFTIELVRLLSISGILTIVPPHGTGHKAIRGEDKVLLPLSFRNALAQYFGLPVEIGSLREDFFIHHVTDAMYVREAGRKMPDYFVDDCIFEIGGDSKGDSQIRGMKNAYLVKESLSIREKEIPLYIFGLLF